MIRPYEPQSDGRLDSQAAAGSLMMRLALHRPNAREAWQDAVSEYRHGVEQIRAQKLAERRRTEQKLINSAIRRAPRPAEPVWREAPQSHVVVGMGQNEVDQRTRLAAESKAEVPAAHCPTAARCALRARVSHCTCTLHTAHARRSAARGLFACMAV